jgi:phospholipase C
MEACMSTEPANVSKGSPADVREPVSGRLPIEPPLKPPPPAPARFATFTMDSLGISNTRSLHTDTDVVYLSATVGANPTVFVQKPLGDLNNGTHSVGLSVEVDIPDDDTIAVFNYLILNNGHGGNDAVAKAAQSALSTIAKEIINNGAVAAAAITIGSIVVPFFVSALAALAGILEAGLLAFADCDGTVAAGALPFTCSELIKRTNSGQRIPENADHHGTDSNVGCGSNSQYSTACAIATAPSIQTVLDLRGEWVSGGVAGPFVSVTGNSISIDMSALHRPTASGSVLDSTHISVNFPDDKTYTAVLQAPNLIKWSNNSSWTKVAAIDTVIDLNGPWISGGVLGPVITVHGNSISIDMSSLKRPTALGTVVSSSAISVNFPDDKSYTAVLQKPGEIRWSNNSAWTKFDASVIKHLFVLVMENRSFDHLLGYSGITGTDTQTGQLTGVEGLISDSSITVRDQKADVATGIGVIGEQRFYNDYTFQTNGAEVSVPSTGPITSTAPVESINSNLKSTNPPPPPPPPPKFTTSRYPATPTAGDTTYCQHDVQHQFFDVMRQLCGQGQALIPLNGADYPPVAEPTKTGFAADYALNSDAGNPGEPMRCFAPDNLPVLNALAKEFVLCDRWFSAMAGPTEPNRMFVHAATSGVWDDSPTPVDYRSIFEQKAVGSDYGISFFHGTIFDALRRAKVPFRIYTGDGYPQVGLLSGISLYDDLDDFENFAGDLADPTYDAAYTFIEPRYDTISQQLGQPFVNNSQHPANSVALGEGLIKSVYEAIRNSPHWNESMLIVTYDEHGGFFDHVTPPCVPTNRIEGVTGKFHGFKFDQYGPRVPAVVISPWCPRNMIEHRQLEHSFIPATIEQLFGLQPLTARDTGITGLQTLATLAAPRNVTTAIPDPISAEQIAKIQPTEPAPGNVVDSDVPLSSSGGSTISGKTPSATPAGASCAASAPVAQAGSAAPLNLSDPWLASTLAVAIKAHIEAVPADAENIKARGFGLKTVGDLAQYYKEIMPIVHNARVLARQKKVAARKQPVLQTGTVQTR